MWKWIIILIIVVIVVGYIQSKKAKQEAERRKAEFEACKSGCAGCANRDLCTGKQNNEKN